MRRGLVLDDATIEKYGDCPIDQLVESIQRDRANPFKEEIIGNLILGMLFVSIILGFLA